MNNRNKIKKQSAVDLVYDRMKTFILDGTWPMNQRIPSEAELSDTFGVNRLTVRLALQKLNTLGVLDTRVGDGTYVRSFNFDAHIHELSDFYMNPHVLESIQEYRSLIELECARLAILRATDDEIESLGEWCLDFERELDVYYTLTDPEARRLSFERTVDLTLGFQTQLCRMSHNDLLSFSFAIAKEPIRRHMLLNSSIRIDIHKGGDANIWAQEYRELYAALKARDAEKTLMHLERIITTTSGDCA